MYLSIRLVDLKLLNLLQADGLHKEKVKLLYTDGNFKC